MPFFRQSAENRSGLSKRAVVTLASSALAAVFGVSVAVPIWKRSRIRSQEAQLERHLRILRDALRLYRTRSAPPLRSPSDLVEAGILSELPVDPFTGRADTWRLTPQADGIHSGSERLGLNGRPYSRY
jgi:general secretion pathway protein G